MVSILSRNVLAKGQIVLPKTVRDLLGIKVGDVMDIQGEGEKVLLSKRKVEGGVAELFKRVCESTDRDGHQEGETSMEEIKHELEARYAKG